MCVEKEAESMHSTLIHFQEESVWMTVRLTLTYMLKGWGCFQYKFCTLVRTQWRVKTFCEVQYSRFRALHTSVEEKRYHTPDRTFLNFCLWGDSYSVLIYLSPIRIMLLSKMTSTRGISGAYAVTALALFRFKTNKKVWVFTGEHLLVVWTRVDCPSNFRVLP